MSVRLRCAIYTRKSSEEGLDQNFNSLHAQREACEAYVLSQAGEGWVAIKAIYDDGGYSGGNMDRPALKQLLADIARGLVDIVVVYKVDRLTRALTDFARIVESFDAKGVSFVSITQAFNTTSSMGRLTLNVLLSFAQFEREVTGERIRDKVAASKAKGLRMGGRPPLGYDIADGRLAVNVAEAGRVRAIFQRYLELGSVHALVHEGVDGKRWANKAGATVGGGLMSRGAVHYLLRNPVYRGVTCHKQNRYEDTHPAIVPEELWAAVQARLDATRAANQPRSRLVGEGARLQGKVFDDRGNPMVIVHTNRRAKRYRYYLSKAKLLRRGESGSLSRISAGMLEQFLQHHLRPWISAGWCGEAGEAAILTAVQRTILSEDRIEVRLATDALSSAGAAAAKPEPTEEGVATVRLAFEMRRRQGAVILHAPGAAPEAPTKIDRALVRAVVLARSWMQALASGEVGSITALAEREGLCSHYTSRLLPLAFLAPDLVELVLAGRQPRALTLQGLTSKTLPADWKAQRRAFAAFG
ncbi:MAG: hypothetical protein JWQ97_3348 [Phenylobacterium sp.]|nr:hypothetical protein [Phenylobacterium sp.]